MSPPQKKSDSAKAEKNAVSDEEARKESSKAANQALAAQQKAKKLKDAAEGAGDPDERQKLMEQAIDAQIEAESFGKTAKYLRSGTFQGMAIGTGVGIAPGASLGALTGTLVGGVTSTITGGLGGGIGAAAGALHGPFWNLGEMAGKGIKKATGINSWGWDATPEQKKTLEKMVGQINEEDMPKEEELGSWAEDAKGMVPSAPSLPSISGGSKSEKGNERKKGAAKTTRESAKFQPNKQGPQSPSNTQQHKPPRTQTSEGGPGHPTNENRKKPRKLETRSDNQKKPRKLEVRSDSSNTRPAKPSAT